MSQQEPRVSCPGDRLEEFEEQRLLGRGYGEERMCCREPAGRPAGMEELVGLFRGL
jgi:hypothetical protein